MQQVDAPIRISAILAIVVGAFYAQGAYLAFAAGAWRDGAWPVYVLGVLIPLVPGVLALAGRMTALLPFVWGWVLGVHLPKLLVPRPQIPQQTMQIMARAGKTVYVAGPDYAGMLFTAAALAGLALYFYGAWRARRIGEAAP